MLIQACTRPASGFQCVTRVHKAVRSNPSPSLKSLVTASLQGQPGEALPVLLMSPQELKSLRGHLTLPPSLNRKILDGQLQVLPPWLPLLCMC